MKKYKDIFSGIAIVTALSLAPLSVVEAVTTSSEDDVNKIAVTVTDGSNKPLATGNFTNQADIKLDWDDVSSADSYELHTWSETKAPSVRLLANNEIDPSATVTKLTSSDHTTELLREGNYFYAIKAVNDNGDILRASSIFSLTYDKTAPKVFVINPKFDQEIIGNSLIANGTVSDANFDHYYFILRDSTGQTILISSQIKESVTNDVIANLDISTFLSGNYDIAFVARDKAGNQTTLTDPDETASFIVVRKGDGNNFSNPPRPIEPIANETVTTPAGAQSDNQASPKFKLVSNQAVLGATNSPDSSVASMLMTDEASSDAKIFAVAKSPVKQSHNVLYLALIPIAVCIVLVYIEKRQTVTPKP